MTTDRQLIYDLIGPEISDKGKYMLEDTFTFVNDQITSMNPLLYSTEVVCAADIDFLDYLETKLKEKSDIVRIKELLTMYNSVPFAPYSGFLNTMNGDKYSMILDSAAHHEKPYHYEKIFLGFVLDKLENIPIKPKLMESYNKKL